VLLGEIYEPTHNWFIMQESGNRRWRHYCYINCQPAASRVFLVTSDFSLYHIQNFI